ncbi:MAG: phosphoenolpyruvate--protein phosphotransferase [Spirochaetales bacterium]|nr:phosphoenolpyruvate--protein phosphotransferase [Spirochaetales bacterium]
MIELKGIDVSPGIVIGKAFLYTEEKYFIPKYDIPLDQIKNEYARFLSAVKSATDEMKLLVTQADREVSKYEGRLLDSHILMINDLDFKSTVKKKLSENKKNVEWIVSQVIDEIIEKLNSLGDDYLKERSEDFLDISQRLIRNLLNMEKNTLSDIHDEVIIISHSLLPSDILSMDKSKVKGIATDGGGKTSHIAILTRSFEIPAVIGLGYVTQHVNTGDEVIIDGNKGRVIINPDEETKTAYVNSRIEWQRHELQLKNLAHLKGKTKDGTHIDLKANIEVIEEINPVRAHGADGIGLFRSEFLFLQPGKVPTEEDQYLLYSSVLEKMENKPVTIRTLDFGGEKIAPLTRDKSEENPILGWRAVRFYLSHPEVFRTQMRALLRSSVKGNLRIMFPMISSCDELDKILEMTDEVKKKLDKDKIEYKKDIPIGIMIEVPSAALTSDILAKKVAFFSIGTNDLIQYTIAVDRCNEKVAYLYEPLHPAVLRLIKIVVDNARDAGIPCEMCGEMAGDPFFISLLVGLGLRGLSMSPYRIPEAKKFISSFSLDEVIDLTRRVLEMKSALDINKTIISWAGGRFDINSV